MANEFLSSFDKDFIDELASGISDLYFSDSQIMPAEIAEKSGISFSFGHYKSCFDGLLECEDNRFHIFINKDRVGHQFQNRARFTFAHELGHFFIDSHRNTLLSGKSLSHCSFTGFKSKNLIERQADYFASCLLMPFDKVRNYINRRKFEFSLIDELSKKFGVSISATAIRFSAIGNHPILLVYSKKNQIKWYWYSDDFPFKRLKYDKTKLPEETVASEYFSDGYNPIETEEVYAADWFYLSRHTDSDRKFFEHAVIKNEHCLSIIWEE